MAINYNQEERLMKSKPRMPLVRLPAAWPILMLIIAHAGVAATVPNDSGIQPKLTASQTIDSLRGRFAAPPKGSGTTTLWWLNGKLTKEQIREQMLNLRDKDGFGGVAPLAQFRAKPATEPEYLTDEYFEMYGCILETAKELGMTVVFYDDNDFPSGRAGNQMAEKYPDDLLKYLERAATTVDGPAVAEVAVPPGPLMSVVAKNLATGQRRVVTREATRGDGAPAGIGGSAGFRQPPEETARYEYFRVLDEKGRVLFEDRFQEKLKSDWVNPGASRIERGGLRATDCQPMRVKGLKLPAKFTIESRLTILRTAAAIALGVKGEDDFMFWQFNARQKAIRPHLRRGGYRQLGKAPFTFEENRAYDVRLAVDGETVTTWIDGKQVARHKVAAPSPASPPVRWTAPAGRWEVQAFVCATEPRKLLVDYLEPKAVAKFMGLTFDRFYHRFPSHFGSTIRMSFYDDLAVYQASNCLLWTPSFNEKFQKRFGRSAEALYPALWEDIGPETGAARASLLGLRNELFAAGYPRSVEEWGAPRGMKCSGHPAGAYQPNPLQTAGDAILFYKYQGVPLTDYIHYYGHGVDGFKIPASAAYNFDRDKVVCEIYGNFHQKLPNDSQMLYRAGMEAYARGINSLLPHGAWWDPDKMRIPPEISWRNPAIGPGLAEYNRWAARCETLLCAGRHAADIAVLYPIDDLEARYSVGLLPSKHGELPVPGSDYYELSRLLTGEVKRDFTFLHPETLDGRCAVDGAELVLNNTKNWERYRVVILPACRTIRTGNLTKLRDFLRGGGRVIATTCLPERSAEFGRDAEVQKLAREMFGPGGKGIFVPTPDEMALRKALDDLSIAWDVRIDNATEIPRTGVKGTEYKERNAGAEFGGGNREFAYIHRSVPGAEAYFFSNSSDLEVKADVTLRGRMKLELWDPHTGAMEPLESSWAEEHGQQVTRFKLKLPSIRSVFVIGR